MTSPVPSEMPLNLPRDMAPFVLTIAGHDPSGGAGILADIKTFQAFGVMGLAAITSLTVQTHDRFEASHWVDPGTLLEQARILLKHYPVAVVKIGLIRDYDLLSAVCAEVRSLSPKTMLVWDPILKASAGTDFHTRAPDASLLSSFDLITPNLPEGQLLSGFTTPSSPWDCGAHLARHAHVLVKGGHGEGPVSIDLLFPKHGTRFPLGDQPAMGPGFSTSTLGEISGHFDGPIFRVEGPRRPAGKHGSGCTLSAAIASCLALGDPMPTAVLRARHYTDFYLQSGPGRLGVHPNRIP